MRRETDRRRGFGMNVGSASLVMVFTVLCLTIFAVLSVVTARNEWNLAKKSADAVTAYYAADSRAAEILAAVRADYDGAFRGPDGAAAAVETIDGRECLSYRVPVDARQELCVLLYAENGAVRVAHWAVEASGTWTPAESVDVWDGGM
jgi:hypothetical protein